MKPISSQMIRSLTARMRKTNELKLGDKCWFNPRFVVVDRVLNSTEVFTSVHHKKANEIKGTWAESLMMVCSKMLNFVKDGVMYGVLLLGKYEEETKGKQGHCQKEGQRQGN